MIALLCFFLTLFASPFKSKSRLEAENAALRHQLIILRRKVRGRVRASCSGADGGADESMTLQADKAARHWATGSDPSSLANGRNLRQSMLDALGEIGAHDGG